DDPDQDEDDLDHEPEREFGVAGNRHARSGRNRGHVGHSHRLARRAAFGLLRWCRRHCLLLLSSGRKAGDVHDLQLDAVGIVEEHGVIAGLVPVLLRTALDLGALGAQPFGSLVHDRARHRLEREMVQADAVAVIGALTLRLGLAQTDRGARAPEVPDRLAAFALHLADAVPAERAEQIAVEGQAALDRRDDEIDVMDACGTHVSTAARVPRGRHPSCTGCSSTTTWSRATGARSRPATSGGSPSAWLRATGGSARSRCTTSPGSAGTSSSGSASGTA